MGLGLLSVIDSQLPFLFERRGCFAPCVGQRLVGGRELLFELCELLGCGDALAFEFSELAAQRVDLVATGEPLLESQCVAGLLSVLSVLGRAEL
jgi:hypothetical protein